MHKIIFSISFILLTMVADARRKAPVPRNILDGNYSLFSIQEDGKTLSAIKPSSTITFDSKKDKMTAFFGCNRMHGEFEITSTSVYIGNIVSTEMFCSELINNMESRFGRLAGKANKYKISGNRVKFFFNEEFLFELKKKVKIPKKKIRRKR